VQICSRSRIWLVLVALLCVVKPARAWKPRSHALTANAALADALDAHICLRGLSRKQIFVGQTPLVGHAFDPTTGWQRFNDLVHLGPYVRAGAIGPDAFPDAFVGQVATHVDWSRKATSPVPLPLPESLAAIFGSLAELVAAPLTNTYPPWRSIDWGHEVVARSLQHNLGALGIIRVGQQPTRAQALADPLLRPFYLEHQAAVAFGLGYLMHMGGDSFAHQWINEWTGQPFALSVGRRPNLPLLGAATPALEEFQHIAMEAYADSLYEPGLAGEGCDPVDAAWLTDSGSLCESPGEAFPVDCDYCNPLRGAPPDSKEISGACDQCYTCNPWREVCPPRPNDGLPCAAAVCKDRDARIADCVARAGGNDAGTASTCERKVSFECAALAYDNCCKEVGEIGDRAFDLPPGKYNCGESPQLTLYREVLKALARRPAAFGPHCSQVAFGKRSSTEWTKLEVHGTRDGVRVDESLSLPPGKYGIEVDLNGDGQPDLINECMYLNCLISPGTANCPLNALKRDVPTMVADKLQCEPFDLPQVAQNPDPLLNSNLIAVPFSFYKQTFLQRRFVGPQYEPAPSVGALGTTSLGGPMPNGVYAVTDALRVLADAANGINQPLAYIIEKCTALGNDPNAPECQLALELAAIKVGLRTGEAALALAGLQALASPVPLLNQALALAFFASATVIEVGLQGLERFVLPGLALPLEGMRSELVGLLEQEWFRIARDSADGMSGRSCVNSCGGTQTACTEHKFFGLQNYFTFALDALSKVTSLECPKNNYITRLKNGTLTVNDWLNLTQQGFSLFLTQYVACAGMDILYGDFQQELKKLFKKEVLQPAAKEICDVVGFQAGLVADAANGFSSTPLISLDEKSWSFSCQAAIFAYYGQRDDPLKLVEDLRELITALDSGGLTPAQKDVLYPRIEQTLLSSSGIRVDLRELETYAGALDCNLAAKIIIEPDRAYLIEAFRPELGDKAADALRHVDRQLGVLENTLGPASLRRFHPLYNTIQLNKLILLGTGEDECERLRLACSSGDSAACAAQEASNPSCKELFTQGRGGIFGLVSAGNGRSLPTAFASAYSTAALDASSATYLQSFFRGGFADTNLQRCREMGFNLACNAFYSLDDPDDYCREVFEWDARFVQKFRARAAGLDPKGEIALAVDAAGRLRECGPALNLVDQGLHSGTAYHPTGRRTLGPAKDPHNLYTPLRADGAHLTAPNHRSTLIDRVVAESVGVPPPEDPLQSDAPYRPHDLTRFSLLNKDEHVARLYSAVFAPYHCPEDEANQADADCDTVPDLCDNCPAHYNPDQLDRLRLGIGDECLALPVGETPARIAGSHTVCETLAPPTTGCCARPGSPRSPSGAHVALLALPILARWGRRVSKGRAAGAAARERAP